MALEKPLLMLLLFLFTNDFNWVLNQMDQCTWLETVTFLNIEIHDLRDVSLTLLHCEFQQLSARDHNLISYLEHQAFSWLLYILLLSSLFYKFFCIIIINFFLLTSDFIFSFITKWKIYVIYMLVHSKENHKNTSSRNSHINYVIFRNHIISTNMVHWLKLNYFFFI